MTKSAEEAPLNYAPIYGALVRPALYMGISIEYYPIALMVVCIFYIGFNPIYGLISCLPVYLFGYFVCKYDPDGFRVLIAYVQVLLDEGRIKKVAGAITYDPF